MKQDLNNINLDEELDILDLDEEEIVYEDDVYYEVIKAVKRPLPRRYTKEELYFGPILLANKSDEFVSKWNKYKEYLNKVIVQINNPELSNSKMLSGLVRLIENAISK